MFRFFGTEYPDTFHILPGLSVTRSACPCCGEGAWILELSWFTFGCGIVWQPDTMEGGRGA
jgi:hypothetical protein